MSNLSHIKALLAKEVKLKEEERKKNFGLKDKIKYLNQLLEKKNGYCTREPLKLFPCDNENEWHDNIRLEAKLLTYEAENIRLLEDLDLEKNLSRTTE